MEFYNLVKEKVQYDYSDERDWYLHSFGVIDTKKTDFLEEIEAAVNYVYRQEFYYLSEKASAYTGEDNRAYCKWLENRDLPLTCLPLEHSTVLVCKNMDYYKKRDGSMLVGGKRFNEKIVSEVNDVIYRNGDNADEKEMNCAMWILKKMGVNVSWEKEQSA